MKPPPETYFLKHPSFLTSGLFVSLGNDAHPQLPLFLILYSPWDSPGPVPVTEDAAISCLQKKKMEGIGASVPRTASMQQYLVLLEAGAVSTR